MIKRIALFACISLLGISVVQAQQCPVVDQIDFPVDVSAFSLVQDYAARNPRHDGRYHTGEDWHVDAERTFGQPIRAIAAGRATYAYARGWGRDGGVVILEHTMPDEQVFYSVYGHLMETETAPFPAGSACVDSGDVIGAISDAAPVPHLHFEVRRTNPGSPGLGYTLNHPDVEGHLKPSRFIQDWQARLGNPVVEWITPLTDPNGPIIDPLPLNDDSLLIVDDGWLARVLPDGRQLWRTAPDGEVVATSALQGNSLVHYANGRVQVVDVETGVLGEGWQTNLLAAGPPFALNDVLVFPAQNGGLVALGADRRSIAWRAVDVPRFERAQVATQTIGLMTRTADITTVNRSGLILDEASLRHGGDMAVARDGTLLVYTTNGLWSVSADGNWLLLDIFRPALDSRGAVATDNSGTYLFNGETLMAHSAGGAAVWEQDIPGVRGDTSLSILQGILVLTSTTGQVYTVPTTGSNTAPCTTQFYASGQGDIWHQLGEDGLLRIAVGGSIAGLNWAALSTDCLG